LSLIGPDIGRVIVAGDNYLLGSNIACTSAFNFCIERVAICPDLEVVIEAVMSGVKVFNEDHFVFIIAIPPFVA